MNFEKLKAFSIDFNWGPGGPNDFAAPGLWAGASPAEHVQWYQDLGANTIQTFCVSCNGYAWNKNGVVPQQSELQSDFLPEMVRLGHEAGMLVMGYFCPGANTLWGQTHPELSYGIPHMWHIPYADAYLAYLGASIADAVSQTGIDGFMTDLVSKRAQQGMRLRQDTDLGLDGEAFADDGIALAVQPGQTGP